MAEVNLQASNTEISSEILNRELAQVRPELQEMARVQQMQGASAGESSNLGSNDILTFSLLCDIQRTSRNVIHVCVMTCIVRHKILGFS